MSDEPSPVTRPDVPKSWASLVWFIACAYLVAHVPFLPRTPFDLDGVNFALALHDYDLTKHQPHPPGSPLFVGLGRLSRTTLDWVAGGSSAPADGRALDAAALALWSACLGAVAVFGVYRLYAGLGQPVSRSILATAVTVFSPLFWFSGVRPMSDLPGLAVGVLALGALAPALGRRAREPVSPAPGIFGSATALAAGCFLAGLAPGMRVQMAWLTWPATAVAIFRVARRGEPRWLLLVGAVTAGVLTWLVPLGVVAGGPSEYLRLLQTQAAEDVGSGRMLIYDFTARNAALAIYDSLIVPWGSASLGWTAAACAAAGAVRLMRTEPRTVAALALVFGPYTLLHLGLQDTQFVRYALPLAPLVGLLVVGGLSTLGRPAGAIASIGLCALSLGVATAAVSAHSGRIAPAFQAVDDMRQRLLSSGAVRPVVAMHNSVALAVRGEPIDAPRLPSPVRYEWLELARYWRSGGTTPVWFLGSRRRTDLALIDPQSRTLVKSYAYPRDSVALLAGSRPRSVDWVEIAPPGWVALTGWALTPEIRGVSVGALGSHPATARALVKRRRDEIAIVLGGRNLGGPCATAAVIAVAIDGREVERFATDAGSFVHVWRLPPGALTGTGAFAELTVIAEDRSGLGRQVDVAFEQFDVQGPDEATVALADGWFEPEIDAREGSSFRWMSERASLRVDSFDHDVALRLRGGSPQRDFSRPSVLTLRAGDQLLAVQTIADDFDLEVNVRAHILKASGGVLEIEASQAFVPDARSRNGDQRSLALRIFGVGVSAQPKLDRQAD
jgi:hypothetical protein